MLRVFPVLGCQCLTHDPPLKFVGSVHSGAVKGEMSNPIVLTEVFGDWVFNRVLP